MLNKDDVYLIRKAIADTLMSVLSKRDLSTYMHSVRASIMIHDFASLIGITDKSFLNDLYYAGLLHDIGKLGMGDDFFVIKQLGSLEFEEAILHPIFGKEILSRANYFVGVTDIILHHHERYDGSGYPDGLKGDKIPFFSRILCIVDSFDAIVSFRYYKQHRVTLDFAFDSLEHGKEKQFDPDLVDRFMLFYRSDEDKDRTVEDFNYVNSFVNRSKEILK